MTIGGPMPSSNKNNTPTDVSENSPLKGGQRSNEPDSTKKFMYFVACFANLVINLDHGIMPACTQELQQDLGIDQSRLGLIMSVVYIGLMLGSITSGPLLQAYPSKKIIILSTCGNILALTIFPMTDNFFLLCLSRILVGFFQVFLVIYFPVWVDIHGGNKKTIWITYLQLGVALGVVFGYGLTAMFVKFLSWRASFYLQIVMLAPCLVAFSLFQEKLMATSDSTPSKSEEQDTSANHEKFLLTISHSGSFFENEIRDYVLGNEKDKKGGMNNISINEEEEDVSDKLSYFDYIRILRTKKVYIFTMLAVTSLYFVITGIQSWISDYMRIVLGVDKEKVFVAFGVICITGPTIGVLIGGNILDKLGGYTGKEALNFCLASGIMAALSGIAVPFLNNFLLICALLWLVLFFGGALMPAVIGIMLSSIPKKIRPIGYSSAQIVQNLCGYFPAPVLYGAVVEMTGGKDSRYGMIMLMSWSSLGVFALLAAKNARNEKHANYMAAQYVQMPDEEANKPDLFQPKPKMMEMQNLLDGIDDSPPKYDGSMSVRRSKNFKKTFADTAMDFIGGRKRSFTRLGKIEEELQTLNKATVDHRYLRKQKTSILSKDNLGNFNLMFGRPTLDKQNERIDDEML